MRITTNEGDWYRYQHLCWCQKSREADPFALPLAAIWRMSLCRSNKKVSGKCFSYFLTHRQFPPSEPRNIWRNLTKTPLDGWRFTEPPLFNYSQSAAGPAGRCSRCLSWWSFDRHHTQKEEPKNLCDFISCVLQHKVDNLDGNAADRLKQRRLRCFPLKFHRNVYCTWWRDFTEFMQEFAGFT
jgi:hypothetical protein